MVVAPELPLLTCKKRKIFHLPVKNLEPEKNETSQSQALVCEEGSTCFGDSWWHLLPLKHQLLANTRNRILD